MWRLADGGGGGRSRGFQVLTVKTALWVSIHLTSDFSFRRYRESICRKGNGHFDEIATQTDFFKLINKLINVIKLN